MKWGCGADLHLRASVPVNRQDDFVAAQLRKVEFIIDYAYENMGVVGILWAGDLYDNHDVPDWVVERYIHIFKARQTVLYDPSQCVVFGQHDQRFHTSDKRNTPLGVTLAAVDSMKCLGAEPFVCKEVDRSEVHIYGMSWGEEVPTVGTYSNVTNILVAHQMTTEQGPLWPGHEGFVKAQDFLRDHPEFKFVLTGDNHQQFMVRYRGRVLINPGSVMRSTTEQVDFEPAFFVLDTVTGDVARVPFPIEEGNKVFRIEKVEEAKARDERLEKFIMAIQGKAGVTISFKRNLSVFLEQTPLPVPVKEAIQEIMK